jgi:hypothetical protein
VTGPSVVLAVRTGDAAESIRFINRRCTCEWSGPHLRTPLLRWRRTAPDPKCVVHRRPADPDAAAIVHRARVELQKTAA